MSHGNVRIEKDTFGPIEVPAERLWGAQTQRSLEHFRISGERMPREIIRALVLVKRACGRGQPRRWARSTQRRPRPSSRPPTRCWPGAWPDEFPLVVWQTGSGTQTNMNVNEVLANRASELLGGARGEGRLVHPNDDVNRGQSSNDVFPTAMHVAAVVAHRASACCPRSSGCATRSTPRPREFDDIVKIGRTHLQDATPLTLGQEFSGYVAQLDARACAHVEAALPHLCELALGGTAVGTGLNAHPEFGERVAAELARAHRPAVRHRAQQVRGARRPRRAGRTRTAR